MSGTPVSSVGSTDFILSPPHPQHLKQSQHQMLLNKQILVLFFLNISDLCLWFWLVCRKWKSKLICVWGFFKSLTWWKVALENKIHISYYQLIAINTSKSNDFKISPWTFGHYMSFSHFARTSFRKSLECQGIRPSIQTCSCGLKEQISGFVFKCD